MLEPLRRIVQEVNSAPDFAAVLEIIVERVKAAMNTGMCSIYLFDPISKRYVLSATRGLLPESVGKVAMTADQGLVGLVASRAEPVNLEHAETHPRFAYFPETGEERFSSFLGAPIIHQREVLGVLVVQQQERRRFDESEEAFLITVSAQLAGVIAHADATGELVRITAPGAEVGPAAVYPGIASAPGIGIGYGVVVSSPADLYAVPKRRTEDIPGELEQFRHALERTQRDVHDTKNELRGILSTEELEMFDVYLRMLEDHSLGGEVIALIHQGFTAQSAWSQVIIEHIRTFSRMESEYLRERASDVRDLGRRVLEHLQQTARPAERVYPEDTVLIGEELAAPHLAAVPFERIRGIVSVRGSHNSHMAIIGRAMGIPTVMGAVDLPWSDLEGQKVIVDGHSGQILIEPTPEVERAFQEVFHKEQLLAADLLATRDEPSVTACGEAIALWVNTGLRVDTKLSLEMGAAGVGLYRTEIPFFLQERFPSEEEQRQIYRDQLLIYAPRPVTMRTLDIGGDKALPYFPISEENPFLGWRGIRITLDHPEIFIAQIRAMMRASEDLDNLRILLPMISSVLEVDSALALISRVYTELTVEEGYRIEMPKVGAMIEVPAAVYQTRELAQRVDFLSVGTNDLTQYLLAVDRNNPRVAALYHGYHPALLRALRHIATEAAAVGREVSVCGELAGDPLGAVLLIGLGYRTLSMSAANLLRVKAVLRQLSIAEMTALALRVSELADPASVQQELQRALQRPSLERLLRTHERPRPTAA
ncbi:MAG: phosphoenolpyruvate--protein phosphotransferase [Pseudomonadota bacterium]|jgi:phosphotransferase system, enzyme I, PtsP